MGRPPICHAFTMVRKSFCIPAILFYLASDANKSKWGDALSMLIRVIYNYNLLVST
jgi:hypothetical protein